MALFDTLTDADAALLEAHVPEGAFTWTKRAGDSAQIVSNGLENITDFQTCFYSANVEPVDEAGDWELNADIEVSATPLSAQVGLVLLADPVAWTGYEVLLNVFTSGGLKELVGLSKHISPTTSASPTASGALLVPAEGTFPLKITKVGTLVTAYWKGVEQCSITDDSFPLITAIGIRYSGNDVSLVHDYRITELAGPEPLADNATAAQLAVNILRTLLDRRVTDQSAGVSVAYAGGNTTWTLPYEVPVDDSEGVLQVTRTGRADLHGIPLTTTRPAPTQIRILGDDYSSLSVAIGIQYEFLYQFSTFYKRSQQSQSVNQADTGGRLQLLRAVLQYRAAKRFDVHVTPRGRTERVYVFEAASHQDGEFRFPILTRNLDAEIIITNDHPVAGCIYGLRWEGHYYNRSRSV